MAKTATAIAVDGSLSILLERAFVRKFPGLPENLLFLARFEYPLKQITRPPRG